MTDRSTGPSNFSATIRALPRWAWIMIGLAAAGGIFWIGHRQGQREAGYDAAAGARERARLESQTARLEVKNSRLNARVAELEMARQLDREAYNDVERTLGDLQSRLDRQSDDLAFYRSIVSPADGVQGLRIQRFALRPGTGPREFVVEVTLIQALRQDSPISGLVRIAIQGMQHDRPTRYSLGELTHEPHAPLPFSFRYFQTLERTLTLPEGFQPFEVEVTAQSGRQGSPVRESFNWKVATTANGEPATPVDRPREAVR